MKSSDYWKDRQTEDAHHAYEQAEDLAARIARIYRKATGVLNHQSAELFKRFRKKYGLTEAEARKLLSRLLNKGDIDRLIKLLEAGPNSAAKTEILKELEAPAYQARLERYRQLQNQIDQIMRTVYRQEKEMSSAFYTDLANESYYRGIFRMQQRAEAAFSFSKLDPEAVDKVIKRKWSGSNYSERIWKNTRTLANELKEEFAVSFLTGRGERETARIIANKFSQGATVARRLVRTETNYIHTEMNMEAYEDAQVEEYLFLATLDLKTSKICRSLDGKIFPVAARKSGKNCPPMHPWCRSTTIAVIDRELLGRMQRSAWDPVKKKRIKVPLTMSYEEWYEKYVKGHEEQLQKGEKKQEKRNLTQEQFERYRERGVGPETYEEFLKVKEKPEKWEQLKRDFKDTKDFEKYREVLGNDIPDNLEKFQDIKYNDKDTWSFVKLDFTRRRKLLNNYHLILPGLDQLKIDDRKFTEYFFNIDNPVGWAKGEAYKSRLGYNEDNWELLQTEIYKRASIYPATYKRTTQYGDVYEQRMIIYGMRGKPANVEVGWIHTQDGITAMTTAYITEVKNES